MPRPLAALGLGLTLAGIAFADFYIRRRRGVAVVH